ncbi:MAG TPA: DUF6049 family protein [Acidimicrobiia bacterium]|nr:DUF6049 family protein [Acidimicrobiia bacterium]
MRPLLAALALASLAVVAPVPAADAQEAEGADVTLVDQDAWAITDAITMLRVRVEGTVRDRELRLELHDALSTRTGFEQTVEGGDLGEQIATERIALADRPPGANGELVLPIGTGDDIDGLGAIGLPLRRTGVYPLRVAIGPVGGDDDASFVTWLVVVEGEPVREPLGLAWIWSIGAPPELDANGAPSDAVLDSFGPGGDLEAIAGLLERASDLALTLDISPQTAAAWAAASAADSDLRPGLTALRRAARRTDVQVLAAPYVPLDMPAAERAGLDGLVSDQVLLGIDTLERVLDIRVDPRTRLPGPLDDAALGRLRRLVVDRLVVADTDLEPVNARLTPARPFRLEGGGSDFRSVAANTGLRDLLERQSLSSPEPRALRAQRFLAGLSLLALEEPAAARGVVVAEPMPWDADPALVDLVLQGLDGHPLVATETLDQQFSRVDDDVDPDDEEQPLVRRLGAIEPIGLAFSAADYADARAQLTSFASVVGGDDPLIARGEEALRVAPSKLLDRDAARAELGLVRGGIAGVLADVRATDKTVTLTSREAEIPVSFVNGTDEPVNVRLRLESSKLLFPAGEEQDIALPPGNTTLQIPVEARASGTFTMDVTLTSTDGYLSIGEPAQIRVRSTVFSGTGAVLTGGAAAFLVVWWGNHIRRTRRAKRSAAGTPA